MAQTINTNSISLNAQRNLSSTQSAMATSMQRLSSGLRINTAKDDAAGLAISDRMNAQVKGMNVAIRNANDAVSMLQTADGAAGKLTDMLQRMRELAVQAANGTNNSGDIANLAAEYSSLTDEITRVTASATFNGTTLLDAAAAANPIKFQVGPNTTDTIDVNLSDLATAAVAGIAAFTDTATANAQLAALDTALTEVTTARATYGAAQNRVEAAISSLQINAENLSAARGRIVDADFAHETANLARVQILQQAGTAMVAQANQLPQSVLQLLKG
jgi:flagellin